MNGSTPGRTILYPQFGDQDDHVVH